MERCTQHNKIKCATRTLGCRAWLWRSAADVLQENDNFSKTKSTIMQGSRGCGYRPSLNLPVFSPNKQCQMQTCHKAAIQQKIYHANHVSGGNWENGGCFWHRILPQSRFFGPSPPWLPLQAWKLGASQGPARVRPQAKRLCSKSLWTIRTWQCVKTLYPWWTSK